ncbi:MAG TPA: glycosyltransferase family 2 protein [Bryobacteraceae bacterium]|nr:glycosyltransferase family 2 protein [Bryobacteraceae bacterium]
MNPAPRLSIAIPIHNEEQVLPELLRRLRAVLDALPGGPHQLVFADDGSTDSSLALLEQAASQDPRVVVVALSRNYGHQAAISAALDYVDGEATVVMDGDLQDLPEAIPQFLERFAEGYDVVYAQRIRRKEPLLLRACYFLFYRLMARLSDVRLPLDSGDFSLMSRRVVEHLRRMPEHHRYLRGMRAWVGFKQIGVPVERAERAAGKSKFSLLRLLKLASDGIFAFSIVPIRAAALFGAAAMVVSFLYALYSVYAKLFLSESPKGFTALIVTLTFLAGILLLFLGIIGEYVGRVYEETKARPHYVVARIIGLSSAAESSSLEFRRGSLGPTIR